MALMDIEMGLSIEISVKPAAHDKVYSCNLPYAKTSSICAKFGKVLFIRAKNLSKVARTREVFP